MDFGARPRRLLNVSSVVCISVLDSLSSNHDVQTHRFIGSYVEQL